jgi:hypothetical protein
VETELDLFINMPLVLYEGVDVIPGMTTALLTALENSGYIFVSQMFSEFIKRIGTEKDTTVINQYKRWLKKIYSDYECTDLPITISDEVTHSMQHLAEEKGLIDTQET